MAAGAVDGWMLLCASALAESRRTKGTRSDQMVSVRSWRNLLSQYQPLLTWCTKLVHIIGLLEDCVHRHLALWRRSSRLGDPHRPSCSLLHMPDILPRCRLHVVALSYIVSEHQHARTYLQYQFIAQTGCRKTRNLPSELRSAAYRRSVFFQHAGAPDARGSPPSLQNALCGVPSLECTARKPCATAWYQANCTGRLAHPNRHRG